jgi:ABC-type branched-subunit amino acid transport system ATPase component
MAHRAYIVASDILSAERVFVSAGSRQILSGAAIRASRGTVTGLLGRNGAGKSVLLQSIFGTMPSQDGNVHINGVRVFSPYTTHRLVNYLPQRPFIPGGLRVATVLRQYSINTATVLQHFPDLEELLHLRVWQLSGGYQRLLSVLIILLAPTRFSLLDEPFAQLMPLHIQAVRSLIGIQKHHKGIILTDHRYQEIINLSDALYLLRDGQSIHITHPQQLVSYGYLSHSPVAATY